MVRVKLFTSTGAPTKILTTFRTPKNNANFDIYAVQQTGKDFFVIPTENWDMFPTWRLHKKCTSLLFNVVQGNPSLINL